MDIQWKGSANFNGGRQGYKPLAIINHIMCGTLAGTDDWFSRTASQVSAHFGIGKDGTIHQYVSELDTAWANGRELSPDTEWLSHFPNVNPNLWTISIEHEGYPQDGLTPAQAQASIALHKYLVTKWNIPIDENHISGHFRIDSISRADCPGDKFPWQAIFKQIQGGTIMEDWEKDAVIKAITDMGKRGKIGQPQVWIDKVNNNQDITALAILLLARIV